jgi:hypothetical protein
MAATRSRGKRKKCRGAGGKRRDKTTFSAVNELTTVSHPSGKCGNIGCKKCHGVNYSGFLLNGKPHKMPMWMYQRWLNETKNTRS